MYFAMNRFRVRKGAESEFERIWRERERFLGSVPGFCGFFLLRGPEAEDHRLYATQTQWDSQRDFINWTRSEAFRKAHAGAAPKRDLYLGPPNLEGFETLLEEYPLDEQPGAEPPHEKHPGGR